MGEKVKLEIQELASFETGRLGWKALFVLRRKSIIYKMSVIVCSNVAVVKI